MVYVFLANGFEEMEAIAPIDLLRRAELKVVTVAVGTDTTMVTGAHGVRIHADITEQQIDFTGIEMAVLPGGMPGTLHLEQSTVCLLYTSKVSVMLQKTPLNMFYHRRLLLYLRRKKNLYEQWKKTSVIMKT